MSGQFKSFRRFICLEAKDFIKNLSEEDLASNMIYPTIAREIYLI